MDNSTIAETWKPIVGYEGAYEVSDLGRVRGLDRMKAGAGFGASTRRQAGRIKVQQSDRRTGHRFVTLYADAVGSRRGVHTLVAEAFIGPRPDGMFVCHNDSDSTNNTPGNLRYDTPASNSADMVALSRQAYGVRVGNAVLTDEMVAYARARWIPRNRKHSIPAIARDLGVNPATLKDAVSGRRWRHVK